MRRTCGYGLGETENSSRMEISTIESLLGTVGQKQLFGYIRLIVEGEWHLEDLGGIMPLDLSLVMNKVLTDPDSQEHDAIYTDGCMVLVSGEVINSIFKVSEMIQPPIEDKKTSEKAMGSKDIFGNNFR